ncbi:hypothetical protein ACWGKK_14365 [Streptomyces chartreusis]
MGIVPAQHLHSEGTAPNFTHDTNWPYGRAVLAYRESMANPIIIDYREVTHLDSCRV